MKRHRLTLGVALLCAAAPVPVVVKATDPARAHRADLAAIKGALDAQVAAVSARNIDGVMAGYVHSDDLVEFDAVPPMQFVGWDALRVDYLDFFRVFPGKVVGSYRDLHVGATGGLGYAFSLQTWDFTKPDGSKANFSTRVTQVFRKTAGRWLIFHEHVSVPADLLGTGGSPASK